MAQQTAVDWLLIWFDNNNYHISSEIAQVFEQAKAMEWEQILDAHIEGQRVFDKHPHTQWINDQAEQYYNETYGSDNQI